MSVSSISHLHYVGRRQRLGIWAALTWRRIKEAWGVYSQNWMAVLGLVLILIYAAMAIAHPILMKTVWPKGIYDPVLGHDIEIFPHPSPPSAKHLLGTDALGRDVLSTLLAATRPSFLMAITAAITTAFIGTLIGAISAYFRGVVDSIFAHLADVTLLAPAPLVMVIIGFVLDIQPVEFGLIFGILAGVGVVAIVLRSHALTIMSKPFIEASRVAGAGAIHIVFKHLVPHMLPLAAVNMMLTVTGAIFANGFIAFLGLSRAQLNWGSMIYDSFTYQQWVNTTITWNVLIPSAMAISLFAAAFYLIGIGLHEVAEPRIAERRAIINRRRQALGLKTIISKKTLSEHAIPPTPHPVQSACRLKVGETCIGTLLFARLHGKYLGPENVEFKKILGEPLRPLKGVIPIVSQYGGLVNHIDETSMIISFGLFQQRLPPQVSALLATHTGLELVDYIGDFNAARTRAGLPTLNTSIGIATGSITVHEKSQSDNPTRRFLGKAVNTAQRLQQFTVTMKSGGLLISEETYKYLTVVQHQFFFGRQGLADIPWESNPKMVYEIVGRRQRLVQSNKARYRF